ncbi:MAG: Gfo/Idh/MocA family oxidoreductase [Gemmataceae bacterium]|nr:Gfo/Idh/MocA family oxidoreductase [Gemmataceae bacterium]
MLRCGVIGYGAWGTHHARVMAAHPGVQLCAIAAKSEATRAKAVQDHPEARVYAEYRDLLAKAKLDAVAIVLPSHLHFETGKAVLEAGCHLLLEKPMCLNVPDCEALIQLAQKNNKVLAVGHEMRQSTLWGRVKQLIDEGAIGQPLYVLIELWRKPYRLGADGWRYDSERVGNWILEEPVHFFDLARWYLQGFGEPTSVYGRCNGKRADHPELHDHFAATITFSGGQYAVIAQCLGGWEHHQIVKLSGTEGALWAAWSGAMDRTFTPTFSLRLQRGDKLEEIPIEKLAGEVFELESQFDRFVQAITPTPQGHWAMTPAATGDDGLWAVRMCLTAQEAAATGVPIAF